MTVHDEVSFELLPNYDPVFAVSQMFRGPIPTPWVRDHLFIKFDQRIANLHIPGAAILALQS